jgi:putative Holliday junction resolvase
VARSIGIDFGEKRVGLAVGNNILQIITPLSILHYKKINTLLLQLAKIFQEWEVEYVIIGVPLSVNNLKVTKGTLSTLSFLKELKTYLPQYKYQLINEQLTSHFLLKKRGKYIDHLSASIILNEWFERRET